jgi:hypothetical protein
VWVESLGKARAEELGDVLRDDDGGRVRGELREQARDGFGPAGRGADRDQALALEFYGWLCTSVKSLAQHFGQVVRICAVVRCLRMWLRRARCDPRQQCRAPSRRSVRGDVAPVTAMARRAQQ